MKYAIVCLCILAAALVFWVVHLKMQLHSLCRQLEKRLADHSRSYIYTALLDPDAERLAKAMNRCFEEDEKAKLALEREEKRFRETIANISHDLRTPLTSVKGYLQLLEADLTTDAQHARMKIIKKHTDELGDLIEHFFEYAYLLSDDSQPTAERFCLTDEVAECLAAAVPQLEEKGMAVSLGEFRHVNIIADREKTVRIIQNLVRNCIHHSAGDIAVSVTESDGFGVLTVENPVAHPEEIDVSRLFDRFYTAEKSRRSKSTGLGLSIVKILSEQMGGRVSARLDGDKLAFTVRIPV